MTNETSQENVRPLNESDLDRVIQIDATYTGRPRRGFFEKRLAAALREPRGFIYVGCESAGELDGFVMARVLHGEFGRSTPIASMDAIGVSEDMTGKGTGQALMQGLEKVLREKGIFEIQTQLDWTNFALLKFLSSQGFGLTPRRVLERSTADDLEFDTDPIEEFDRPARDRIACRSMNEEDLAALVRIGKKISGEDQQDYFERILDEALNVSGIRVSLVAEIDGAIAAYMMARVDFGDFGRTEPMAVLDSVGVDPDFTHQDLASSLLSQLNVNLAGLRIDWLRTEVRWNQFDLLAFLDENGFSPSQRLPLSRRLAA